MRRHTLRHPFRGERYYAKPPSDRQASRARARRPAARQPRMRPRRSMNVAAVVASPEETPSRPLLRLKVIGLVVLVLFVVMVLRLWSLQVLHSRTYTQAANANQTRTVTVPAPRGLIVDRRGTVMAGNRTQKEIVLSRVEASQHPSVIGKVAALVTEPPATVQKALTDVQYSPYEPVPIMQTAPTVTVEYLDSHRSEYPGVSVQQVTQRQYPQGGSTGTYILGYVGSVTGTDLKAHPGQGYTQSSQIGKTGVEEQYEHYLRGKAGTQTLSVDAQGNVVGTLRTRRPTQGDTVVLNVTVGLQQAVQQALTSTMAADRSRTTAGRTPAATDGGAVVLNVENGAVLALASSPTYSLTTWVGGISTSAYQALSATCHPPTSYACPLNDNAIQGLYTPGSTFKLATATAALNSGLITPYSTVDDTGKFHVPNCTEGCTFKDATAIGDEGTVNVTQAITRSDDYFFYTLGFRFWNAWTAGSQGQTPVQDTANAYGFGELTHIDLPDEVQGSVATPAKIKQEHQAHPSTYTNGTWQVGTNIEMAFGQATTVVTPIEEAQAYATFADRGTRYAPEVANEIVGTTGKVVQKLQPKKLGHVTISDYTALLAGFEGVVSTSSSGTGYTTFHTDIDFTLHGYPLAGKTGTADLTATTVKEPNSWFVGFGPTNSQHQYVVAVAIAQGGYGADAAAPAVAQIFNYLYHNPITTTVATPTPSQPASTTPPTTVPLPPPGSGG
ncbi:MAG: penicillin-binding transpeptidase domain-containing protein [Acidimicrobiales bacterium]